MPLTRKKIYSMKLEELQDECRKAGLVALKKPKQTLRTRLIVWLRSQELAAEMVCPITLDLLWDPVLAGDGVLYERSAIEQYFSGSNIANSKVNSPITGEEMGRKLREVPQIKRHVEALIEYGSIQGNLATEWKETQRFRTKSPQSKNNRQNNDNMSPLQQGDIQKTM